ncbi:hypothetical protein [Rhodohalobacter sulfatireducens]|uniref:Uncharacterized protein n=1 Tax=Rhodohalobacter sulfatireducens TaxID=2911366 RepID=A0ABS9KDY7_9BACT|nr:hypothetical protein [Rhodohalobacter sulfatireducens]MCG2589067.1 hypothetical protein [Rhodohalobacter sulfatireducens]
MEQSSSPKKISHSDKEVSSLISKLDDINLESSYYLILVAGPNKSARKKVLSRVEKKIGSFKEIDLRDVIKLNEDACYKKIDELFSQIGETEKNLHFIHGDALAGEYTGFTYSSTRYATPQEKYLLKKIKSSEKFVIIELEDVENIDKTLERYSQTAILCNKPTSAMGKFLWKLKQIKVHGHTFSNKRPKTA